MKQKIIDIAFWGLIITLLAILFIGAAEAGIPEINSGPGKAPGIGVSSFIPTKVEVWRKELENGQNVLLAEFYGPWEEGVARYTEYTDIYRDPNSKERALKVKRLPVGLQNSYDNIDCAESTGYKFYIYWTDKAFMSPADGVYKYVYKFINDNNVYELDAGIMILSDTKGEVCFVRGGNKKCL